MTTY